MNMSKSMPKLIRKEKKLGGQMVLFLVGAKGTFLVEAKVTN